MEENFQPPFVTHKMVQQALENFFDRGGKIIETENPYQNSLVKQSFAKKEIQTIFSDSFKDNGKSIDISEKILEQEISAEDIIVANPDSEYNLRVFDKKIDN
jgi:hypothetical protein